MGPLSPDLLGLALIASGAFVYRPVENWLARVYRLPRLNDGNDGRMPRFAAFSAILAKPGHLSAGHQIWQNLRSSQVGLPGKFGLGA